MPETTTPSFEDALQELDSIVKSLEGGSLSLQDALACFERGIALTKSCQQALSKAEQKIATLTDDESQAEIDESLNPDPHDD